MAADTPDHGATGQHGPADTLDLQDPADTMDLQGPADTMDLQGRLFTDLDRLAFALEMEVAESLRKGDPANADRLQDQRLGVRLAQRLVAGVWADEVNLRLQRWDGEYERRVGRAVVAQEPGENREAGEDRHDGEDRNDGEDGENGPQPTGPEGNGTGAEGREVGAPS